MPLSSDLAINALNGFMAATFKAAGTGLGGTPAGTLVQALALEHAALMEGVDAAASHDATRAATVAVAAEILAPLAEGLAGGIAAGVGIAMAPAVAAESDGE